MLNRETPPDAPEPVEESLADALPGPRTGLATTARRALGLLPVVLLALAIWVLWREFHHLSLAAITAAMGAWGPRAVTEAVLLCVASFILMGVIEWFGLRWSGARIPWAPTLWVAFIANAIAHSLGANLLVSGAIRARLYDRYGVTLTQVAATTLFGGFAFAVGLSALSGAGLLLARPQDLAVTAIPLDLARPLGAALLAFSGGYVVVCGVRRRPLTAFGRSLALPSAGDAAAQLVVGLIDNGIAAAIVWVLLPPGAVSYATFVGAYAVACVTGLASSVPGGAGVFEGAMATLLRGVEPAALAAAFLGYRLVYYLAPLVLGALALAAETVRGRRA